MLTSKKEMLAILDRIQNIRILVVGDLILDRYIWGSVERISPEAPVPIVDSKRSDDRLGGAGNAARNLRTVGASVDICGFIGNDTEGEALLSLLERDGIGKEGVIVERGRPTSLKTRVIAQGQQMLRIDRESRAPHASSLREGFAAVVDAHIDQSQAVILSDYGKGCVSQTLMKKFKEARKQGRIGLNVRPLMVDPHPASYDIYDEICVAKPNRKEAEAASGVIIDSIDSASFAAKTLLDRWKANMMVITLGEDGLIIQNKDEDKPLAIATVAREVFDVSGAGDTVTALFAAALAAGASPTIAGELANIGAGIVVSEVGTVAVDRKRLVEEIERLCA